jgi:hypothetical protein
VHKRSILWNTKEVYHYAEAAQKRTKNDDHLRNKEFAMSQENDDLATHVSLCHLRYEQLQEKIDVLEQRLTKMENNLLSLKNEIQSGFADIALKIEKENNKRSIQLIASAGSIVVAIVGAMAVWMANKV